MIRACIDDLLVISTNNFQDHTNYFEQVIQKLTESGLKVNPGK